MSSFLSTKAVRLFLAVSVSIWMAGGCLFGCSNSAMAHDLGDSAQAVVAGDSCHASRSHDCCAAKKRKKQIVRSAQQPVAAPSLAQLPRGMVKDCPLVVNATAAISKNSGHLPDPARGPVAVLPLIATASEQSDTFLVVPVLLYRGPTYLRCCVFLI
jgi:hypothetical protein